MQLDDLPIRESHVGPTETPVNPLKNKERGLAEMQLLLVQKISALEKFAGRIVHDFNNILAVIVGHGQLLLDQPEVGVSARRRVQQILDAAFRAAGLTGQLLSISRMQRPQPSALNLNHVLEGSSSMLRFLMGEKIDLHVRLDPDLAHVSADSGQMEQVLVNFSMNARDAMPDGGSIWLETSNIDVDELSTSHLVSLKRGRYVRLTVRDSGTGMDSNTLSRLFEPFFTTKETKKSSGLGLATVACIVHQSQGYVRAESEVGRGSTFFVYLPALSASSGDQETDRPAPKPLHGSETILLLEQMAPLRSLISEVLENSGYIVLEADSVAQAHSLASKNPDIDLLLIDTSLPDSSTPALVRNLREERPAIKLLQMTAPAVGFVNYGFHGAGTDCLQKPFTGDGLLEKIRSLLDDAESPT
jgi:two-component system cell cycle sensor histidine kinase/response regulator CckA